MEALKDEWCSAEMAVCLITPRPPRDHRRWTL